MKDEREAPWVWMSHVLSALTPVYGAGDSVTVSVLRSLEKGDTANAARIDMPMHAGTHVDAPRHFITGGHTVDRYEPTEWMFSNPRLLDVASHASLLVDTAHLGVMDVKSDADVDLVLLRTGAEAMRGTSEYAVAGPGLACRAAETLLDTFPGMRAIGLDCVSISSFALREEGRATHRLLLQRGVRIFEDVRLSAVPVSRSLRRVIALPLRVLDSDGAPVAMIGELLPERVNRDLRP